MTREEKLIAQRLREQDRGKKAHHQFYVVVAILVVIIAGFVGVLTLDGAKVKVRYEAPEEVSDTEIVVEHPLDAMRNVTEDGVLVSKFQASSSASVMQYVPTTPSGITDSTMKTVSASRISAGVASVF